MNWFHYLTTSFPSLDSSLGSLSSFVVVPSPEDQVVSQLQTLVNECRHGKNYCKQVLSLYELSKVNRFCILLFYCTQTKSHLHFTLNTILTL